MPCIFYLARARTKAKQQQGTARELARPLDKIIHFACVISAPAGVCCSVAVISIEIIIMHVLCQCVLGVQCTAVLHACMMRFEHRDALMCSCNA